MRGLYNRGKNCRIRQDDFDNSVDSNDHWYGNAVDGRWEGATNYLNLLDYLGKNYKIVISWISIR